MIRQGYTKSAAAVDEEVRKRHEMLRRRPGGDGPQPPNENKRGRTKPPPDFD
jgi:hypothetical protein